MGLSSPGIGSGLDIKGMVEAMVKADMARAQARHDKMLERNGVGISAVGQLKSTLSGLQTTLSSLTEMSSFRKMTQTISTPGYFTATLTEQAVPAEYQIQVQALAQAQTLVSAPFANSTTVVGNGNITINFGTYSNNFTTFTPNASTTPLNINIPPENATLSGICDAINAADSGVTASIVQDSSGARLSLTSAKTGQDYAMQVITPIPGLSYDPASGSSSLTQTMVAQNSITTINGIILNESTNQLTDVLPGVSLNLLQASTTQTVTLSVGNNTELLTKSVHEFVKAYNDTLEFLDNVTSYNQETKQAGYFQSDSQIKNLKYALNQVVANFEVTASNGTVLTLADIGINTIKHGRLQIDEALLANKAATSFDEIASLFAKSITSSTPNMKINSIDTATAAGTYDVVLSEYTPFVSMAGTIGGTTATSSNGVTLNGTGNFSTLSVTVLSGSIGNIGQIIVTDGLANLISSTLDNYLDKDGPLSLKGDFLDDQLKRLGQDQQHIEDRSKDLEKKYYKRWIEVDRLIAQLQSTSKALDQQLEALPQLRLKQK